MIALSILGLLKTLPTYKRANVQEGCFTRYLERQTGLMIAKEVINKFEAGFGCVELSFESIGKVSAPFLEGVLGKVMPYVYAHTPYSFTLTHVHDDSQAEVERVMMQVRAIYSSTLSERVKEPSERDLLAFNDLLKPQIKEHWALIRILRVEPDVLLSEEELYRKYPHLKPRQKPKPNPNSLSGEAYEILIEGWLKSLKTTSTIEGML